MIRIAVWPIAIGIAYGLATRADATVLATSDGFESPWFSLGPLEGQNGWQTNGTGNSSATVQSATVRSGAQAIRLESELDSYRDWRQPIAHPPTGRYLNVDWEMMVPNLPFAVSPFGPAAGVTITPIGFSSYSAALLVDSSTRNVLFQVDGGFAPAGVVVNAGEWVSYRLELDFQASSYRVYVAEQQVGSFVFPTIADRLTGIDLSVLGGEFHELSGEIAFVDNFVVRDGLREDYSGDGVVDAADYTLWRDNEGQTGFFLTGDGDANAAINEEDYRLWSAAFGASNSLASPSETVPEPAAAVVTVVAMAFCTARSRRH